MSERTRPLFCFSPGDQTFVSPPIPDNEFRYGFLCADLLRIDYIIGSRYQRRETAGDELESVLQGLGFDAAQIVCLPVRPRSSSDVSFRLLFGRRLSNFMAPGKPTIEARVLMCVPAHMAQRAQWPVERRR